MQSLHQMRVMGAVFSTLYAFCQLMPVLWEVAPAPLKHDVLVRLSRRLVKWSGTLFQVSQWLLSVAEHYQPAPPPPVPATRFTSSD